jgi:two-component system chemotaxis response regulator CheB
MSRAKPAQAYPTEFSCPDCIGVLKLARDGPNHRDYRCQVGHHFSTRSLLIAKERELERLLWSSAALLEHIMQVYERFLKETKLEEKGRRRLQKRIREARQQKAILTRMIEHTHAWE